MSLWHRTWYDTPKLSVTFLRLSVGHVAGTPEGVPVPIRVAVDDDVVEEICEVLARDSSHGISVARLLTVLLVTVDRNAAANMF